ncbi:MAG: DNA-binding protein [Sulfolobales archaeon]
MVWIVASITPARERDEVVVVGRERPYRYALDIIVRMNQGSDNITIIGRDKNIPKAITVYNILRDRLGAALELRGVNIGSTYNKKNRRISYIEIKISRKI